MPTPAGRTLLEALRDAGFVIDAPCGGAGTCGKCRVLVRTTEGVGWQLACQVQASDVLEVSLEPPKPMEVCLEGEALGSLGGEGGIAPDGGEGFRVAVDVGTTTVVARLLRASDGALLGALGRSNPQIPYGADVISRISSAGEGTLRAQHAAIDEAVSCMVSELCRAVGVGADGVAFGVLAGNTVMETMAAGIDPAPIGAMPFTPHELFGGVAPVEGTDVEFRFAPCIAGYVGGDVVCGMLACGMDRAKVPTLLLDLGTNGEMVLADSRGMTACATAAGPVFEGANIAYGMPAYPGAIASVRLVGGSLVLDVIGGGEPMGICGTGLIDAVACLLDEGAVDESGLLDADEASDAIAPYIEEGPGGTVFRLSPEVVVTQKDIRCLQLAKAAVSGGIRTLAEERGVSLASVELVAIAGGFGGRLDVGSAVRVGLIPAELGGVCENAGNTAIEGASACALSEDAWRRACSIASDCDYLELSTDERFNGYYVSGMEFPE